MVKISRKEKECQSLVEEIQGGKRVQVIQELLDAKELECQNLGKEIADFRAMFQGVSEKFNSIDKGEKGKGNVKLEAKKIKRLSNGKIVKPKAVVKAVKAVR